MPAMTGGLSPPCRVPYKPFLSLNCFLNLNGEKQGLEAAFPSSMAFLSQIAQVNEGVYEFG